MILPYRVPDALIADWASGRATLVGAILKDTATGKIVGHIQQTNVLNNLISNAVSSFGDLASKGFSPLEIINVVQNEQLKQKLDVIREGMVILQNLHLGTLAVSGLGLGVSIVGFAVLAKRLRSIETRLDMISQQLVTVTSDRRADELRAVLADIGANVSAVEVLSNWTEPRRVAEQLQSDLNKNAHRLETIFVRETDFSGRKSLPIEHLDRLWAIASALHLCHEAAIQALFIANEIPVARTYALASAKRSLELLQQVAVAARGDVVGQHREVIRDDQIIFFIRPGSVRHGARLGAPVLFVTKGLAQHYEVLRCETPPSGVSVRTESRRTCFNCGAVKFQQHAESSILFETVSIWMKGGWKETRGVQRPTSIETPVSESRTASLNPFDTKRKKAPPGASSRVCNVQVAVLAD